MKYRTIYRICLFAVIILTLAGGIFYYVNYVQQQDTVTEGTLVKGWQRQDPVTERALAKERQKPGAAEEALAGGLQGKVREDYMLEAAEKALASSLQGQPSPGGDCAPRAAAGCMQAAA